MELVGKIGTAVDLRTTIPCTPAGVPLARRVVASNLPPQTPPQVGLDVQLLTSEAVTNAVRHSGCTELDWIALRMAAVSNRLRVEVEDPGLGFESPETLLAEEPGAGGYGLHLLNEIAEEWGVSAGPPTVVWFELPLSAEGSQAG